MMETYIRKRQNAVVKYIATRSILEQGGDAGMGTGRN